MSEIEVPVEEQATEVIPAPAPDAAADEGPTWPQGADYDPREDLGPPRPEDEPVEE